MEIRQPDSLYKNIVESLDMVITHTDNGQDVVSLVNFDTREAEPFVCGGKRLAMCSQAALLNPQWDELQYFHPLCENAIHGESEVLRTLLRLVSLRVTSVALSLLQQLVIIAADRDSHSKLTSKQHVILTPLANVTEKTPDILGKILDKLTLTGDNRFLSLYMKPRGVWRDAEWNRVCTVTFPLYQKLTETEELAVYGVKIPSKKEKANIVNAIQYLFPQCQEMGQYSHGSNNLTAPQFHALIMTYVTLAHQLNKTTALFKKHLDTPEVLMIDVSWAEQLDNLSKWREVYPSMPGNTGDTATAKPAPTFKAGAMGNEVSTVPLAPIGGAQNQIATKPTDLTPVTTFAGFNINPNPLGNLGAPIVPVTPAGYPIAGNGNTSPTRTADGKVIFQAAPPQAMGGFGGYPAAPSIPGWNPPGSMTTYPATQASWNQPQPFSGMQQVPFGRL